MIIRFKTFMNSAPGQTGELELPENASVGDALDHLGLTDHLELATEQIVFLINGRNAALTSPLAPDDQLLILQSMMGG